jgi:TolB-like protein
MKKLIIIPILVLITAAAFAQAKPRLGILPFTGGTGRDGDSIANLFANSPDLGQEFRIVPRTSSIDLLMKEQAFQRSGLTDSDTIADLGKQMNADYVVSGHITLLGNKNLLLISIVDVKTMQQVAGVYEEYDKIETIRSLLPPMARRISAFVMAQSTVPPAALAVLPLNIMDSDVQQEYAEILAQILATEIANSRAYAVFPRTKTIEAVMAEQEIQRSGLTDRESMIEIGKATNAGYVLAGTITKLGSMNLFDVKILNIESGEQVNGADRDYADLSDGVALMGELAYGLIGIEADKYAEARKRDMRAVAAQQQKMRRDQNRENFRSTMNRFLRGDDGNTFSGLGAQAGLGVGNREYLGLNGFVNINVSIPLFWTLFAEVGVDIGLLGAIKSANRYSGEAEGEQYGAYRPYGRLNISFPMNIGVLLLPYAGVGFGWTSSVYEFRYEENLIKKSITRAYEYAGADLVFGAIAVGKHHGFRAGLNLNNISNMKYFELQVILGYIFRF